MIATRDPDAQCASLVLNVISLNLFQCHSLHMHLLLPPSVYKAADWSFNIKMQNVFNKLHLGDAAFEIPFEGNGVFED